MKPQRLFYILLISWVLVDLLQAIFTPVHSDEAYYALYGRFLDWGYYDHPPMVALLTAFSGALFKGNLSIRFATVLLHGATVWLIWKSLPDKELTTRDVWVFFAVAASLVMFSVYGFITTPDAPLLFFTALFFYLYRLYLGKPTWPLAIALGITFAAMLYSKYMAVLVAGCVWLSNVKLLKDKKVWVAACLSLVLFTPHIL
jgi:4-amino-4-deoxy-L-arabinose transferase-like glycosyltransferase